MTVVLHDAIKSVQSTSTVPSATPYINVSDILYADDTMLIHDDPETLEQLLHVVVTVGSQYGLEMH